MIDQKSSPTSIQIEPPQDCACQGLDSQYRQNVGIIVMNREGFLLWCRRVYQKNQKVGVYFEVL